MATNGSRNGNGMAEAHPSTAAIAGHPLHPTVVPLPIGALALALAADVAYARTHERFWALTSRFLLGAGLGTGVLAAPLGLTDLLTIEKAREEPIAWAHGIGNVAAMGITALNLNLRRDDAESGAKAGLALSVLTMAGLLLTGWLGGELSYRQHIGMTPDGA